MRSLISLLLILTLGSCGYTSLNPLSKLESSQFDNALCGVWYSKFDNEEVFLHLGRSDNDPKILHVVYVEHDNGKIDDHAEFKMYKSEINGQSFMNIFLVESEDEKPLYYFLKYEIENSDNLIVEFFNLNMLEKAIEEKKLKGIIKKPKKVETPDGEIALSNLFTPSSVEISDESANLINFILDSNPNQLYSEPMEFKRLSINAD